CVARFEAAPPASVAATQPATPAGYAPPASAAKFISAINLVSAKPFTPGEQIKGLKQLRILANNVVFLDTDLATDADGSPRAKKIDPCGHLATAYNIPGQTGQARFPNAETIPYIVLPGCNKPTKRPKENYLYRRLGLQLGDIAAVIWGDRIEFALFADVSANDQIGEGSIALVESLGFNPWNAAKTQIVSGIPGPGVLTFVFPGSRIRGITPQNAAGEIRRRGAELFRSIGGSLP
ncbi:MAG: glycoside hydrolase family 75 protein, partial [Akkermansiaceae bacterium]|nr:glycoside hydrolase family 75 protein [Akkermansiaceae bacterium]